MRLQITTKLLLIFTFAACVATIIITEAKQNQTRAANSNQDRRETEQHQYGRESESRFPVVDYRSSGLTALEDRRRRKNSRYDRQGFVTRVPSPHIGEVALDNHWAQHLEPLPANQSNAIIIGQVLTAEAHLSNDRTGVYSEFAIRVDEVLKTDNTNNLLLGRSITADRAGGFVRYHDGYQRLYRIRGQNMLGVGQQYVLFLSTSEESPNYRILTAYELRGEQVFPLDFSMRMNAYSGMSEAAFLSAVREAIAASSRTSDLH